MPERSRSGFTLIEILVVIAILAVLAGILFPVLAAARERGRIATCQSNLRQIGIALGMYLQDWDEYYPNTDDPTLWMGRKWRWPLKPYLALSAERVPGNPWASTKSGRGVLLCPSDTAAISTYDNTSYAYSMSFYHSPDQINAMTRIEQTWTDSPTCISQSESAVQYPSDKALVSEWTSTHESPHVGWGSWDGARNYLMADGHCKYLRARRITPANDGWPDINLTHDGVEGRDLGP